MNPATTLVVAGCLIACGSDEPACADETIVSDIERADFGDVSVGQRATTGIVLSLADGCRQSVFVGTTKLEEENPAFAVPGESGRIHHYEEYAFEISFEPLDVGEVTDTLVVVHNGRYGELYVPLAGTGVAR